jgi:hypothetical protein
MYAYKCQYRLHKINKFSMGDSLNFHGRWKSPESAENDCDWTQRVECLIFAEHGCQAHRTQALTSESFTSFRLIIYDDSQYEITHREDNGGSCFCGEADASNQWKLSDHSDSTYRSAESRTANINDPARETDM